MSTIKLRLTRDMPDRSRVVAKVELRRDDPRGLSDAFSVTGEVYEPHGTWSGAVQQQNGREWDSGGCVHDDILRAFPGLAPLVALHLSSPDGNPMHAASNGWYWYAGSRADLREAVAASGGYTGFVPHIYAWRLAKRGLSDDDAGRAEYCYRLACETLRVDSIPDMPALEPINQTDMREAAILRAQAAEIRTVDVDDRDAVSAARKEAAPLDRQAREIEQGAYRATFADARRAFDAFCAEQTARWQCEASAAAALVKVGALLQTDNPSETAGEWSAHDLAAKLPEHSTDEIAAALEALPVTKRDIGGVSRFLYSLPEVVK